jgi:hypothetical protein
MNSEIYVVELRQGDASDMDCTVSYLATSFDGAIELCKNAACQHDEHYWWAIYSMIVDPATTAEEFHVGNLTYLDATGKILEEQPV